MFHNLRTVADTCREESKGETTKETRKQLMENASAMYHAERAQEATQRVAACAQQWRARTPNAVAAVERDCEQTIAYDALKRSARELIRTTSLVERTNREVLWQFERSRGGHGSPGHTAHCSLVEAHAVGNPHSLSLDILNLNPSQGIHDQDRFWLSRTCQSVI